MENNVPISFKAGNSANLPSAKKMGTLYFTEDKKIYFDIDDTTRLTMSDMDAIPGELKDDGSIYFDDKVYVGGELDDTGNWDPTPVESQSSLHVSGTTHLNEHLYVSEGATIGGHLDVGTGDKSRGLYVNGSGGITGSLDIDDDLRVTGATAINGTLTAKEVKTTSKITAGGSIEANNQIRFKPNTNRDEKVKLSDVINEALDFTFKNRIGIDGADVTSAIEGSSDTFTLRLQKAIKLMENSWPTGITVVIPSGSYEYNDTAMISYYGSLLIKGIGKIPSTISFINNNSTIFDLYSGESGSLSLSHLDIIGNGCNLINPYDSEGYASWDDIILQDCNISNCNITLFGGNKIIIDNCTLTNVIFEGEVDRLLVSNSTFTSDTFTNLTVNVYQNFDKCSDNLFVDENGKIHGSILSADKVNNSLTIKLNSGTTEGTNLFTFNGSTAKSINITPSAIGALSKTGGNVTGNIILDNTKALQSKDANGTVFSLIYLHKSNKLHIGWGFGDSGDDYNYEDTHSVQLNGKILLTSKTYGNAFPTKGLVAGRVFFKKVSG